MTLRARIRMAALVVAAFLVGSMLQAPAEPEHAPRADQRNLVAAAAVHEIARLEKRHAHLRTDFDALAKQLETSEKERRRLAQELAERKAAPRVVTYRPAKARLAGEVARHVFHNQVAGLPQAAKLDGHEVRFLSAADVVVTFTNIDLREVSTIARFEPETK